MEEDINKDNIPEGENKPISGMAIVGYNLLAMAAYTVLLGFANGGFILDAPVLGIHVIFCLAMASSKRNWVWILGALLVLAIGSSTCVLLATRTGMN